MGVSPHDPAVSSRCLDKWAGQNTSMADLVSRPVTAPGGGPKKKNDPLGSPLGGLTARIDQGWRATTPNEPPKWSMRFRRPQTQGGQGGSDPLKPNADRALDWEWDSVKTVPPRWSCTRRGETLEPPGGRPLVTPGVGEYGWVTDNVLVRAPRWTMGMPASGSDSRSSTPGPGTYLSRKEVVMKRSPSWTAPGLPDKKLGEGFGPGVGAYDIATESNMPRWTMLGRPRGSSKKPNPGPGSYKFYTTTNFVHPVLTMPSRMKFAKTERF